MLKLLNPILFRSTNLLFLALIASIIFWILDAVIDVLVFQEEDSILESLLLPEPAELWMRTPVTIMFFSFAFYARYLLARQQETYDELQLLKNNLVALVDERTDELNNRNQLLEEEIKIRQETEDQLKKIAMTDPLTQLYNRRKFNEILHYEMVKDRRYRGGLSLILCDIDHFKRINDTYGHDIGDQVLIQFAQILKTSLRDSDIIARWGGEEFILLVINTPPEKAGFVAEKIRTLIAETKFEVVKHISISVGVASFTAEDSEETLIKRADEALYQAKENGRNTTIINTTPV